MALPAFPALAALFARIAGTRVAGAAAAGAAREGLAAKTAGKAAAAATHQAIDYKTLFRDAFPIAGKMSSGTEVAAAQKSRHDEQAELERQKAANQQAVESLKSLAKWSMLGALGAAAMPTAFARFGRAVVDGQRHLEQFSGGMALAFARLRRADILYNRDLAQRTSGSANRVVSQQIQWQRETLALRSGMENLKNGLAVVGYQMARGSLAVARGLPYIGQLIRILEWLGRMQENRQRLPWESLLNDINNGRWSAPKGGGR